MKKYILMLILVFATSVSAQWSWENVLDNGVNSISGFTGVAAQRFDAGIINKNPALAGYFARDYNLGYIGTVSSQDLGIDPSGNVEVNSIIDELDANYNFNAFFIGHNFVIPGMDSPLSVGLQYSSYKIESDFTSYRYMTTGSRDYSYSNIALGASVEYFVTIGVGFSRYSQETDYTLAYGNISGGSNDYYKAGLHVSKNIAEFLPESYRKFDTPIGNLEYNFGVALGLEYLIDSDGNFSDNTNTGYSVMFDLLKLTDKCAINLVELGYTAESEITSSGVHMGVYETVFYNTGTQEEEYNYVTENGSIVDETYNVTSDFNSLGFSTAGLTKSIAHVLKPGSLKTILNKVSLSFYRSEYKLDDIKTNKVNVFQLNIKTVL